MIDDAGGPGNIARLSVPVSDAASTVASTPMLALFVGVGALVASRHPRNPIRWLLLTTA